MRSLEESYGGGKNNVQNTIYYSKVKTNYSKFTDRSGGSTLEKDEKINDSSYQNSNFSCRFMHQKLAK